MPLPPLPYQIDTPRFTLRLPEEADLPALYAIHSNDAVNRFLPYVTWTSLDDARAWIERAANRLKSEEAIQFVVIEKASGQLVGGCVLFKFDFESGVAELGYALDEPFWGKKYLQEILPALIGFAFGPLGMRRLEAQVDVLNTASHHLLLKLGFEHEGVRRENCVMKGDIKSTGIYGLLGREWRDRMEASA
jgi:[ribosomal protein S5]-alanine N-acetyltransferase